MERPSFLVAMSGGVASSVAAALLLRSGARVVGATLLLLPESGQSACTTAEAIASARRVADELGIEHRVLDARDRFEQQVLRPCWDEFARGRTPSPCILCNERLKLGTLSELADELGLDRVATGHYARVTRDAAGKASLLRAAKGEKDQSYFLFALSEVQLRRLELPLGNFSKPEVRKLAGELGLPTAERPDSQDACFALGDDGSFAEALRMRFQTEARPGDFVDRSGKKLGRHSGLHRYTVGQRRGLGISLGARAFVCGLDAAPGQVVLSRESGDLLAKEMTVRLVRGPTSGLPDRCEVQVRSRHRAALASLEDLGTGTVSVAFDDPQRALTPGQAAVFYEGERVLGGGWIESTGRRLSSG